MTKKTKEEILNDIDEEFEQCCKNIHDDLQANETKLTGEELWKLNDEFFIMMKKQNESVIVTGDGKSCM